MLCFLVMRLVQIPKLFGCVGGASSPSIGPRGSCGSDREKMKYSPVVLDTYLNCTAGLELVCSA